MSHQKHSHPGPAGAGGQGPPSLAAVPFLEKKLEELYEALGDARRADALMEAKIRLRAGDYSQALELVETVGQWCMSLDDRPKTAAAVFRRRAAKSFSPEVLSGLAMVARLLQPLGDWHRQQLEANLGAGGATASDSEQDESEDRDQNAAAHESIDAKQYLSPLLDRRVFYQLFMAARQCGLVPTPDVIMAVRDREVLIGRYQKAFEILEALYVQFNAQAGQRATDLRREAIQYKAGKLKMPVKDWLDRQRRVREQDQEIERARLYFTRVLDALRAIRLPSSHGTGGREPR